jgi:hypothetical protein
MARLRERSSLVCYFGNPSMFYARIVLHKDNPEDIEREKRDSLTGPQTLGP